MRSAFRKPWFSAVSILTLGLGIAACTVVFSLVGAVLLKPLPYGNAGRIVTLLDRGQSPASPADFADWKKEARSFDAMEAASVWSAILTGTEAAEQVAGLQMTTGMFHLLGDTAALGRTFAPDEKKVVVLGDSIWRRRFGASPAVVGSTVRLSGEPYTVVGVMGPEFRFPPFWAAATELWVPMDLNAMPASRQARMLRVFGRLASETDLQKAQSEMDAIVARLAAAYPDSNAGVKIRVQTLEEKAAGSAKTPLLLLFGAVGLLLLIGCSNVASLMLARALERRREIGVRMAIGASTWRIVKQLLGESLLLSAAGGALGAMLAVGGIELLKSTLADANTGSARLATVQVDWMVLAFAAAVSVATGLIFGMVPAWQASRMDVNSSLRDGSRGTSEGAGGVRLRGALVVAETALCLVLLAGAGVLLRSYSEMRAIDPGFDSRNLLTMTVSLAGRPEYTGERRDAFYNQIQEAVRTIPGVTAAAMVNHLPVGGDTWGTRVAAEGTPIPRPGEEFGAVIRVSMPGYLQAMNIPLIRGRDFNSGDRPGAPKVVIVNENMARHLWPGQDPTGKRLTLDDPGNKPEWLTVAGVIRDVRQNDFVHASSPEFYVPYLQSESTRSTTSPARAYMTLVVRTSTPPMQVAGAVRAVVAGIDKDVAVAQLRSADRILDGILWQARMTAAVTAVFAAFALLLACVGIYGVMTFLAGSRSREVGIRIALGADRTSVIGLFLRHGLALVGTGIALGLIASTLALRALASIVYGVSPTDAWSLAAAPAVLLLVGTAAVLMPALRASRTDPATSLRAS